MKHLFIVNPAAGKKESTGLLLGRLEELKSKLDIEVVMTTAAGDAEHIARAAAERGEPVRIYACGGDGTLNEVVNGAAGYENAAITNVPKGTGNDFLKIFGEGWREGFSDLEALAEGPQAAFDLIECNGKLGIGVACVGIDARVAEDVHRYKSIPWVSGIGAYILALVRNVVKGICRPAVVDMGDIHHDGTIILTCACNGRYYGGGFMPMGDAMPDDGVLDFLLVPGFSRLVFLRLVGAYSKGEYRKHPKHMKHWHGDCITISSEEEMIGVVDGETMRGNRFTIGLSEKRINFFWPACLDYHLPASNVEKEQVSTLA